MKKPVSRAGIGASSILLILVAVCLTVFCALALMSARGDRTLTERTYASARAYYASDAAAQRTLACADAALAEGDAAALAALGVEETEDGRYTFQAEADDGHTLDVAFTRENGRLAVQSYRYLARQSEPADEGQALYEPAPDGGA